MTVSEVAFALEQAEYVYERQKYDADARAAMVAATVNNMNSKNKVKISDFIGEDPAKKRERANKQKRIDTDDENTLRQLALDKGLKAF